MNFKLIPLGYKSKIRKGKTVFSDKFILSDSSDSYPFGTLHIDDIPLPCDVIDMLKRMEEVEVEITVKLVDENT